MTLTTRLSTFFLAALGLVLAGFSATLYLLAHTYLYRQVDDRVDATLNTLAAAAEIGPDSVEWEPHERRLYFGQDAGGGPVYWQVSDDQGQRVDGSAEVEGTGPVASGQGQPWRLAQRRLQPESLRPAPAADPHRRPQGDEERKYPALVLTAGVALQPVHATLRTLAAALIGTSLGLWLLAAGAGRFLCRRALLPVTRMAATARTMGADLGQRLPCADTGDELADLGQAFNGLLDRLHESFERQRRFTGDASHQLRTPLTAVLGQLEVALRRDRTPEEYQRVLTSVQGQALHLRQIVEMLLFLARADAEARLPHLERINLGQWLSEHRASWSEQPRAADLRVEGSPDGPLWIETQTPLLGQLADILVENACKYSKPGTPITLRVGSDRDAVCLAVEDQGRGIAAEDLPHVFEPFYRSCQVRRLGFAGVGLGLAIAERIAAAFGGSLTVASRVGRGSCFTLRLPHARPACLTPGTGAG